MAVDIHEHTEGHSCVLSGAGEVPALHTHPTHHQGERALTRLSSDLAFLLPLFVSASAWNGK